ncbi:MAG: uncharacterized protein KVP18_003629 [Porospora cf. gigantea A]|uniref:uncharacterized protein n=2 Tax=Porospora cf. gigantea A TaxID=2853593 RepID=UPI00355A6476|nr:MAG: hypothetical protein KVP18_003629 [Porospora cf. gigantea A]
MSFGEEEHASLGAPRKDSDNLHPVVLEPLSLGELPLGESKRTDGDNEQSVMLKEATMSGETKHSLVLTRAKQLDQRFQNSLVVERARQIEQGLHSRQQTDMKDMTFTSKLRSDASAATLTSKVLERTRQFEQDAVEQRDKAEQQKAMKAHRAQEQARSNRLKRSDSADDVMQATLGNDTIMAVSGSLSQEMSMNLNPLEEPSEFWDATSADRDEAETKANADHWDFCYEKLPDGVVAAIPATPLETMLFVSRGTIDEGVQADLGANEKANEKTATCKRSVSLEVFVSSDKPEGWKPDWRAETQAAQVSPWGPETLASRSASLIWEKGNQLEGGDVSKS